MILNAHVRNVKTKEKSDAMQSYVFAETFKYFYLLFAPPRSLSFDQVIFNTEGHPLKSGGNRRKEERGKNQ